jgi:tRNA modification GTPase
MSSFDNDSKHRARTVFARLTGAGRSAIATTVVEGPDARSMVARPFQPMGNRSLGDAPIGSLIYGRWRLGENGKQSKLGDDSTTEDLVVTVIAENRIEIHSHGGDMSSAAIAETLLTLGALQVDSSEFVHRDSSDIWQFELQQALIHAETEMAARYLLRQQQLWTDTVSFWDNQLTSGRGTEVVAAIEGALRWKGTARHLIDPWRVVLQGPPNVGKSSLINVMVGFERAIVNPMPGTTRDVLQQRTVIDGWPVLLSDTAGIRAIDESLEATAIERGRQASRDADCVIDVAAWMDETGNLSTSGLELRDSDIRICNKFDLLTGKMAVAPGNHGDNNRLERMPVSALTGLNMEMLLKTIINRLVPEPLPESQSIAVTQGMVNQLLRLRSSIVQGDHLRASRILRSKVAGSEPRSDN